MRVLNLIQCYPNYMRKTIQIDLKYIIESGVLISELGRN